jgi:hypothetical protein
MEIDVTWCIKHPERAINYFGEKKKELSELEKELDRRRGDDKECDKSYWIIGGLIEDFGRSYNKLISTEGSLKSLLEQHRGTVSEEGFLQRENQLRHKLTDPFQRLIDIHAKIENEIPPSPFSSSEEEKKKSLEKLVHVYARSEHEGESELKSLQNKYNEELKRRDIKLDICKSDHEKLKKKLEEVMDEVDLSCLEILASKGVISY